MNPSEEAIASLLEKLGRGNTGSFDDLFALVYDELKELAHRQRRRWSGDHTLHTTALVHEVYVKLVGQRPLGPESKAHFRAIAARAMRHVLCNYSRRRNAVRRGGSLERLDVDAATGGLDQLDVTTGTDPGRDRLRALDQALLELEKVRARASRVVECRFFGGMTVEETAIAVGASPRSVKRDWAMAQAWLHRKLSEGDSGDSPRKG